MRIENEKPALSRMEILQNRIALQMHYAGMLRREREYIRASESHRERLAQDAQGEESAPA